MSKKGRWVTVTGCVACHKSNVTLRRFIKTEEGRQLTICQGCHNTLQRGGVVEIKNANKEMQFMGDQLVVRDLQTEEDIEVDVPENPVELAEG